MKLTISSIAIALLAISFNSCADQSRPGVDSPAPLTTPRPQDGPLGTNSQQPTSTTLPTPRSE